MTLVKTSKIQNLTYQLKAIQKLFSIQGVTRRWARDRWSSTVSSSDSSRTRTVQGAGQRRRKKRKSPRLLRHNPKKRKWELFFDFLFVRAGNFFESLERVLVSHRDVIKVAFPRWRMRIVARQLKLWDVETRYNPNKSLMDLSFQTNLFCLNES